MITEARKKQQQRRLRVICCAVNHYNWQVIIVEPTGALFMV
jgi:hypothetical protein